ncbi:MAG: YitT family protein [Candidatus Kapaibacteriales bacterium]
MDKYILGKIRTALLAVLGVASAAFGLKALLLPNGFLDGGVTGISLLTSSLTGIDLSVLIVLINLPFLLMAYKTVSRSVFFKSILSIALLAILVHIDYGLVLTEDKLLIAVFGGVFLGLGIGLAIRAGAVLDGTEVLGIFLSRRFGVTIGSVILVFNLLLFCVAAYLMDVETAMYSILTYIVAAKITDFVIEGFDDYIGITIISGQNSEIKEELTEKLGIGVTVYHGFGGFDSDIEYEILNTIINRIDIRKVYNIIEHHDPKAFCYEFDVNKIHGGVLKKYIGAAH